MKKILLLTACLAFQTPAYANGIESLSFLKGCWQSPDGDKGQDTRIEAWAAGTEGQLTGTVSTQVLPGEGPGDNFSQVVQWQGEGATLTATMPEPGNPKNIFALTAYDSSQIVFTMTSTFSTRIKALRVTYRTASAADLQVQFDVTMADGTVVPAYGYTYKRVNCPSRN